MTDSIHQKEAFSFAQLATRSTKDATSAAREAATTTLEASCALTHETISQHHAPSTPMDDARVTFPALFIEQPALRCAKLSLENARPAFGGMIQKAGNVIQKAENALSTLRNAFHKAGNVQPKAGNAIHKASIAFAMSKTSQFAVKPAFSWLIHAKSSCDFDLGWTTPSTTPCSMPGSTPSCRPNANGVQSISPGLEVRAGLARSDYPGWTTRTSDNPEGVEWAVAMNATPSGLKPFSGDDPG